MLTVILFSVASFIAGALVAWKNTKASLKAKLNSEIAQANTVAAEALKAFKAKL